MKTVIVGGVAAGMSAAARLRRLDEQAEIVVLEKDEHVSFANCGLPYHIGGSIADREALLLHTPESLKATLNLDVRNFSKAVAIDRRAKKVTVRETRTGRSYEESYDKLILAPGAKPLRPPLPGLDHPAIFELRNIADMDRILGRLQAGAEHAVVMGGFIGIETAENLKERGLAVTLVEKMPQILGPLDPEMARFVQEQLERHGITVMVNAGVAGFADRNGQVEVRLEDGQTLATDLVVFALGSVPNTDLAKAAGLEIGPRGGIAVNTAMQTSDPDIYAAGDAVETPEFVSGQPGYVPMAGPANRQGRLAADAIAGIPGQYRRTQGTAILKVFEMTAACTGLNEKALKRAGLPYRRIYLSPNGHAGYYPGTQPMRAKLLFSTDGNAIYGAQIVGYDGVDKRIDIIATAMRGGLGVRDLEHLELAYAPPYGSAKDPVNMAGFIAGNLLDGRVEFWYGDELACLKQDPNAVFLDVRGPGEFAAWHIDGATNLPLPQLRAKAGTLDPSKTYHLYCKVGLRSYLAYRILKQHGLKVDTLAGGGDFLRAFLPQPGNPLPPSPCAAKTPNPCSQPNQLPASSTPTGTPAMATIVDCMGLQCPGPIQKITQAVNTAAPGAELDIRASDPGFARDIAAWCQNGGHMFLGCTPIQGGISARIRKGSAAALPVPTSCPSGGPKKKTIVVFSGDLDKVLAALVIANGALAMGNQVTLFFTFWGLSALRRPNPPSVAKGMLDRMFGMMLPKGLGGLTLSKMHMGGMGTAMMKYVMRSKNVQSAQELLTSAQKQGIHLVACSMSLDVMGLKPEELIDGVEIGGVAAFLAEADQSNATLFI